MGVYAAEGLVARRKTERRVATRIPEGIIRKAVENMKARAQAIFEAKGKDIPRD